MQDDVRSQLEAAAELLDTIVDDHYLLLAGELDDFVRGPMFAARVFLRRLLAGTDNTDALRSIGNIDGATYARLESRLAEFGNVLAGICDSYEAANGVDPRQKTNDPVAVPIGLALFATRVGDRD